MERDDTIANERDEGWMRKGCEGGVISFLCLLLIYSDAPRLSASGANKFLEPPRQLDTPSPSLPVLFPALPFSLPCPFFLPCDPPQRRDIPAASNSLSAPRCSMWLGEKAACKRDTRPHAGILYIWSNCNHYQFVHYENSILIATQWSTSIAWTNCETGCLNYWSFFGTTPVQAKIVSFYILF